MAGGDKVGLGVCTSARQFHYQRHDVSPCNSLPRILVNELDGGVEEVVNTDRRPLHLLLSRHW
jgi:hypothetical protein